MNFYVDAWKKFADFNGRARRKEFWIFWLINMAVMYLLQFIAVKIGVVGSIIVGVCGLAIIVPSVAVAIRRMHDIGKSGWWVLVNLIPLIGSLWFLILGIKDSEPGSNEWGTCPK